MKNLTCWIFGHQTLVWSPEKTSPRGIKISYQTCPRCKKVFSMSTQFHYHLDGKTEGWKGPRILP